MVMRNNNHHQEDQQQLQQQQLQQDQHQQHQQQLQQQEQYKAQHKSTLVIMSMKSQTQSVNLKNKENSTAIMRKQFTPISDISSGSFSSASVAGSIQDDNMSDQCSLTQAGLEEYNSRSYYDQAVFHHQKQSSYAQSEGYHSYVSSSDSSSATPFLDRLRQESELLSRQSHHWSQNDLSTGSTTTAPVTAVTTNGNLNAGTVGGGGGGEQQQNSHPLLHRHHHHHHHHHHHNSSANSPSNGSGGGGAGGGNTISNNGSTTNNNSSESHSSTETLKWLGSMSDVSEASHATGYSAISGSASSSQLIVHSSRVLTPKRHQSESVLYMNDDQQLSPTVSASNSPTRMPAISTSPNGSGGSSGSASSGAIYMSHHQQHYPNMPPQTASSASTLSLSPASCGSLTKGAVAVAAATAISSSSPTLLFPNHAAVDQMNKSSLSVTISGAASPNGSAIGIGASTAINEQQTLHQSLLSIAPLSPSLMSSATAPLQKSSSASPTLSMASLAVAVTSSTNLTASSSPSSSSSSFSSNTSSAMTTTSSSSYRNNHRLFPVSTYTEPISGPQQPNGPKHVHLQHSHQQAAAQQPTPQQLPLHYPQSKLSSPQPTSWQSVADRINDFERQQQHLHHHHHHQANSAAMQKYTFIDPSKTHRVSNPALKAFQKNAVQSYFERQQQQSKENLKHSASGNNLLRPHSLQPTGSPKEVSNTGVARSSLPNSVGPAAMPSRYSNHHQLSNPISSDISFPDCGSSPPPPPPPRSRSLMPVRRSSSASEYAEFRDQYHRAATQENLQAQSVKNVTEPEKLSFNDCGMPPPPPPPRGKASLSVRRTSSASEYAAMREKAMQHVANQQQYIQRQLSSPMGLPPVFLTDEWVPERPPKNPNLRIPSPDLPPPPALITVDTESNLSNQDEPLPPPPPEILRQPPPPINKPLSPNRRNSFAGSPSRKAFFNALPPPPSIPKKPSNMDLMHSRPASSMAQQSNKAHKIILNEKLMSSPMAGDHKSVMVARKRPHNNPAVIPPIQENPGMNFNNIDTNNCSSNHKKSPPIRNDGLKSSPPPPPLKPRMPISSQPMQPIAISSKLRCNSKASYLPRQSLEKLSSTDPDHGSYKLTLTSNEDCVTQHNSPNSNNNSSNNNTKSDLINGGNKCNNLPDVLPVGAKLQPSSPTSATGASQRYGSNNSLSPTSPGTPNYPPPPYPNMKMFITKPSLPTNSRHSSPPVTAYMNMNNSSNAGGGCGGGSGFNRSQSYDASSPKYMSQSTIDLKKTQILETPEEQPNCNHSTDKVLSPAQSESNINSFTPRKEFKDFHRSEVVRKLSLEERDPGEGRIVRAELVNTTLSNSEHKITRKDSLRENIEKITQLQSKLMSAHTHASSAKSVQSPPPPPKTEVVEMQTQTPELPEPPESPLPPALPSTPLPCEMTIISQMEPTTDGLKLMQRTEVILRVNPVTNEVGSQTDELLELDANRIKLNDSRDDALQRTTLQPRQKHPIEVECDRMFKELASLLPQNDRLLEILVPQSCKTPTDYIGKLYNPDVPLRPAKRDVGTSTPSESSSSTPKFELELAEIEVSLTNGASETSCDHLIRKKEELINQITRKLEVLNLEQTAIAEETSTNDELGSSLAAKVADNMRPIDATKFRTYIDDVGHITSLLLSLSGRLAKAENSLTALDKQCPESKILILKRDRLVDQLEEAKRLKEDIDRRGSSVAAVLEKNLTTDEFADYDYFINMKAKLIADSRDIADKISFAKDHLNALNDALIQSDC
ncbi:protein Shroom [Eupeodes corollae]|uniref:protein Shroom n=1 Tax=Eupeodes corollae TaxID=290404 RepID=UPI00249034E1|nr:protein Shroom [Eupeodes corollae]XP_055921589.1 protein Shroom [Eupeodes corollae]